MLILHEDRQRSSWPLARIVDVHSNATDKKVRSVKVKTGTSLLERPINKIVLLEVAKEGEKEDE